MSIINLRSLLNRLCYTLAHINTHASQNHACSNTKLPGQTDSVQLRWLRSLALWQDSRSDLIKQVRNYWTRINSSHNMPPYWYFRMHISFIKSICVRKQWFSIQKTGSSHFTSRNLVCALQILPTDANHFRILVGIPPGSTVIRQSTSIASATWLLASSLHRDYMFALVEQH